MKRTALKRRTPMRKASGKRANHAMLHRLWSLVVRKRAGGRCIIPGCPHPPQGCHYWPEGKYKRVQYDPDNGFAACYLHHIHGWHKDPDVQERIKMSLVIQRGEGWYQRLLLRRDTASRPDKEAIRIALEQELAS